MSAIKLLEEVNETLLVCLYLSELPSIALCLEIAKKRARIDALLKTGGWRSPDDKPPHLPGEYHSEDVLLLMKWRGQIDGRYITVGHVSLGHWRPRGGNGNFDKDIDGWQSLPPLPEANK